MLIGIWKSPNFSSTPAAAAPSTPPKTLVYILDAVLKMLHPFTPYAVEELWGHRRHAAMEKGAAFTPKGGWAEALIIARWPEANPEEGWESQKIADFN